MKTEVSSAATYLVEELKKRSSAKDELLASFRVNLEKLLCERFVDHWHPSQPLKGNAFRCLNVEREFVDPILLRAAEQSGLPAKQLIDSFPKGLALWIDPNDVSCRSGRGSIQPIYKRIEKSTSPLTVKPNASLDQNKEIFKAALKFNPWDCSSENKLNSYIEQQRYISSNNNNTTSFFKPLYPNKTVSWKKPSMKKAHQLQYTGQEFVPNASRHWSQSVASFQPSYEMRSHPQLVY